MRATIHVDRGFLRKGGDLDEIRSVWKDANGTVRESERFGVVEYFTIVAVLYVTKPFWTKFGEKVGEKLGEEVGDDVAGFYRACSSTIRWAVRTASGAMVRFVWESMSGTEDDDFPKLVATSDAGDAEEHQRALDKLQAARDEYELVTAIFQGAGFRLKEVHFRWQDEAWKWSYALTHEDTILDADQRALLEPNDPTLR